MHHTTVSGVSFFVDDRDDLLVSKYRWCVNGGKIRRMPADGGKYLHQILCPHDGVVQFIDGNKLNLSRANLSPRNGDWIKRIKTKYSLIAPGVMKGESCGKVFIFDEVYADKVINRNWNVRKDGYVTCRGWLLHRLLTGVTDRLTWVDHINHDPRDNRMENLRVCSPSENNTNKITNKGGTYFHKSSGKWMAQITKNGKCHYLGEFWSREKAVHAYCEAARKLHGEFAAPIVKSVLDSIDNL